jgi:SAM-dependent methyltransferase
MAEQGGTTGLMEQLSLQTGDDAVDWRLVLLVDAAADTGLLGALPGTAAGLAEQLGLDATAVRVVLDALAGVGVVTRTDDDGYVSGPTAFEDSELAVVRHRARFIRSWSTRLDDRLRGVVPDRANADPGVFVAALGNNARKTAPATVDRCLEIFPDARRVLDLGGGHGEYAAQFARRGLEVTLQDRPTMLDVVRRAGRIEAAGVTLFPGDFFEVLPGGQFDLVFCSGVTHTFSGEHNRTLYPRLLPLIAPGGGLVIITFLRNQDAGAALFAVQMLVNAHGGDTHAEDEYRDWLTSAGFTVEVRRFDDRPQALIVARPAPSRP